MIKASSASPSTRSRRSSNIVEQYQSPYQRSPYPYRQRNKRCGRFCKRDRSIFDIVPQFKELEFIDLGGGFKVPYKDGDSETDIGLLAKKVEEAFATHPNPGGRPLQVWFEPGKFLVSECGYFITKVNVIKETRRRHFCQRRQRLQSSDPPYVL